MPRHATDSRASREAQGLSFTPEETADATRRASKRRRIRLVLASLNLWPLSRFVSEMTEAELDAMLTLVYSTETLASL